MEGFVYCQMAGAAIPGQLCDREQGDTECRGCKAPTRRCAHCKQARGIAEPREGVCASCVAKNGNGEEGQPHVSNTRRLEEQVLSLRKFARGIATGHAIPEESYGLVTRTIDDADNLFALLCQHSVTLPSGMRVIKAPNTVLRIRAGLSGEESQRLLEQLVTENRIAFDGAVDVISVVSDGPVPVLEEPRKLWRPYRGLPMPVVPRPASVPRERPTRGVVLPWRERHVESRAVYEELLRQSRRIGAEIVVSGVVPVVQLKFKIGEEQTLKLLFELGREGHIVQRDGWRSIVVVPEKKAEELVPSLPAPKKEDPVARQERLVRQLEKAREAKQRGRLLNRYSFKVLRQAERLRVVEETLARGTRLVASRSKDKPARIVPLRPTEIAAFLWERNEIQAWMTDRSADPVYQDFVRVVPIIYQEKGWGIRVFLELVKAGYMFEEDLRVAGLTA